MSAGASTQKLASIAIVCGGALWGLYWMPIRALEAAGINGAWPALLMFGCMLAVALPAVAWDRQHRGLNWPTVLLTGLAAGTAFCLYSVAVLLSDVVRVVLLFYLTPVWSTILGIFFLGEKLTVNRLLAMTLGFAGLAIVLGAGHGLPWPGNLGDWFALLSGIAWAIAATALKKSETQAIQVQSASFVAGGVLIALVLLPLGEPVSADFPTLAQLGEVWLWLAATAVLGLLAVYLTLWPATILSPGRVGILLLSEVVVASTTAAMLTGEPFGIREAIGTCLIILASVAELRNA